MQQLIVLCLSDVLLREDNSSANMENMWFGVTSVLKTSLMLL